MDPNCAAKTCWLKPGLFLILLRAGLCAQAQEALQSSLASERVAEQTKAGIQNLPHNIQVGDLKLDLSQSLEVEYNDNVNLMSQSGQSDFIFRPMLNTTALYPIGERNVLKFTLGVGYEAYVHYSAYDRVVVNPGSELSFDLYVKDFKINFHDSFSYELDPGRLGSISGVARYGGFQNTAGASILGDFHDITTQLSYDYIKFISTVGEFDYISRDTHSFLLRSGFRFQPEFTAGLEMGVAPTFYQQRLLNNNVGYSAGAYADWQLGPHFRIEPRAGYSYFTFSDGELYQNLPALGSYYFGLNLQHQVNEKIRYGIDAGRDIQNGAIGDILDSYHVSAYVSADILYRVSLTAGAGYQQGQEKYGTFADDYTRWAFNLGAERRLSDKLTARVSYNLLVKNSVNGNLDYTQNSVLANLTYRF